MRARRAVRWLAMVAAGIAMGQLASVAAPAMAEPVGPLVAQLSRQEEVSATNGVSPKSVTVTCPADTLVYGAAGRINGGVGAVVLDDITPNDALTSVTVTAYETDPDASWSVIAYAMCGNEVLNLQRIPIESATNSMSPKSANPTCPGTTKLYGLGAEITGGLGNVVIDDLTPSMNLTGITVTAYENGAYAGNWKITGYAICGNAVPNMERVAISNPAPPAMPNAVTPKSADSPACPLGTQVHGMGGTITGGLGDVSLDDLLPTLTNARATGYAIAGFAGNWRVTAYAICAS